MTTRTLTTGLAALLLVPVLAACGGDDGPSVSEPTSSAATEETGTGDDAGDDAEDDTTATQTEGTEDTETVTGTATESPTEDTAPAEETATTETETGTGAPTDDGTGATMESGAASPEAAAEQFFRGVGNQDGEQACLVMTDPTGQSPMADDETMYGLCRSQVDQLTQDLSEEETTAMREATVTDATVDGDTATIAPGDLEGADPDADRAPLQLVRIDGRWYIDASQSF